MESTLAPRPLSFLPKPLFEARRPALAIVVGWLTAFVPSIAIAAGIAALAPNAAQPHFEVSGPFAIFAIVVFAPAVETLIMGSVLLILLRFVRPVAAVLISAIGWATAHSMATPVWGLVIWWPFLIFSTLFVTWRSRSVPAAFAMPAAVHALHNLPTALFIASGQAS
jgi:hypothetical protein